MNTTAWIITNMAPLMLASVVVFSLLGYPLSFVLAANGILFGGLAIALGLLQPGLFWALPERLYGIFSNEQLFAIPFSVFMALIWPFGPLAGLGILRPPLGNLEGSETWLILAGVFCINIAIIMFLKPSFAPSQDKDFNDKPSAKEWGLCMVTALLPMQILIFLTIIATFIGLSTPEESKALGGCGALVLVILHKRISLKMLREVLDATARVTTFVVFLFVGVRVFSLPFYGINGDQWIENLLNSLPNTLRVCILWGVTIFLGLALMYWSFRTIRSALAPEG